MHIKSFIIISLVAAIGLASCGGGHRRHKSDAQEVVTETEPQETVQTDSKKTYPALHFKLYLERSGSMTAFDSNNSKGEFKKTVSDMLNSIPNLPNDSTSLFIVNDNVYPLEQTIRDFISERDMFGKTAMIGNSGYTDFAKIFELIMSDLEENQVSILFSDLIYSVDGQESVNAQKLKNEASALTNSVFKSHSDVDVTIIKFIGDYQGAYYPFNSPNKGVQYTGQRPFYAMIFAKHRAQQTLWSDSKYSNFLQFGKLRGYEDQFCFMKQTFSPSFEIKSRGYGKKGNYRVDGHAINDAKAKDGEFAIPVSLNLSEVPLSANYKSDANHYAVESSGGVAISSIKPDSVYNSGNVVMVLSGKPLKETISVRMKYELPRWIAQSSTDDDTDLSTPEFGTTTFAFKEMMEGIFTAYSPSQNDNLFTIQIIIK